MANISLTVAQYIAASVTYTASDVVTISDTGSNIAGLTGTQFTNLAANNIDFLDASDNILTLTAANVVALGTVALTSTDFVTVADSAANLAALTAANFTTLATKGVDKIVPASALTLTAAQYAALGGVVVDDSTVNVIADTGANIAGLTAAQIGTLAGNGFDTINASDNVLSLTTAQALALGPS